MCSAQLPSCQRQGSFCVLSGPHPAQAENCGCPAATGKSEGLGWPPVRPAANPGKRPRQDQTLGTGTAKQPTTATTTRPTDKNFSSSTIKIPSRRCACKPSRTHMARTLDSRMTRTVVLSADVQNIFLHSIHLVFPRSDPVGNWELFQRAEEPSRATPGLYVSTDVQAR